MAGRKAEMEQRKAIEREDGLLVEIEALRNKVAGLELALSLIGAVANSSEEQERPKKKSRPPSDARRSFAGSGDDWP